MSQKITATPTAPTIIAPHEKTSSTTPSTTENSLQQVSNTQIQGQHMQAQTVPAPELTAMNAHKDALPQLNATTQKTAEHIANIAETFDVIMEDLSLLEDTMSVHVDEKTLNFIKLVKDLSSTPLNETIDKKTLLEHLQQLSSQQVPLPDAPWSEIIESHVENLKHQYINAIGMQEHIECLQNIFTQLETASKEDFITIANHDLRFAWKAQEGLQESAKDVETKELLCKNLGEMFIRSHNADVDKKNAPLSFIEHISPEHLQSLSKLCMVSDISIDKLIYGIDEAGTHMGALFPSKGAAQDVVNTYLGAIFSAKPEDFPTTLRYIDALFQHIYPQGQDLALQLKMALAPQTFTAEGIRAQHNLTLSMQDLMHAVNTEVRGNTRSAAIQRAATSATGSVPAFWLTPATVNTITQSKVKDISFRLAHIALLQMEAHNSHTVNTPLSATVPPAQSAQEGQNPSATAPPAQNTQEEQAPPLISDWQNTEAWCKELGLDAHTQELIAQLQFVAEQEGTNVSSMTLHDARAFLDKGMSNMAELYAVHASTRSTAKVVRHNFFNENHKTLYATMGEGVAARMGMRDALVGILHGTGEEQNVNIDDLDFTNLENSIKNVTAQILPPEVQNKSLLAQCHDATTGKIRAKRDALYQESILLQKKEDFVTFRAEVTQRKKTKELAGQVSFFAPQLSRQRQVVCQHIVAVQKALTLYKQDPNNAEHATAFQTAVEKLRHVNPQDLKNGTTNEAVMRDLVGRLTTEITPEDIHLLEQQLAYMYPQAQALIQLAPYKVDPENIQKHGRVMTFLKGSAQSMQRRAQAVSDWLNLTAHSVTSLFWKATDWALTTRKTQYIQKLACLATLKVFANTEGARASDFNLSTPQIQNDIYATLKAWGLNPEADATRHIVKRCLVDFSGPNGCVDLEKIRTKAHDLAKQRIRQHEQDTQNTFFLTTELRARKTIDNAHLATDNADAYGALLDTLSKEGGAYVYNRTRGVKLDVGALHSPLGRFSSKNKRYLLPASVNAEVTRTKGIAIVPLGTGFRVMFKNSRNDGIGGSVNWKIDPANLIKVNVSGNATKQTVSGVAVDFKDKGACLEFLQQLIPSGEIHHKQTDINLHANIFSKAQEIHFLDEEGASLSSTTSFSFLGLAQELYKKTACLTPTVAGTIAGGHTQSRQKNAHGEVVKISNTFTFMASASLGFSTSKEGNIPGIDSPKSTSRKALSKTVRAGVTTKRTMEVHTKDHALSPSTCMWWELTTQTVPEMTIFPDEITDIIENNTDVELQFLAAKNQNPTSWAIQYSLKPDVFANINKLMTQAHVAQDSKEAEQYMTTVHELVCAKSSYVPTKLVAKCVNVTPVTLNVNPGLLAFQAVAERNAIMEKPIVIPLPSSQTKV